MTEMRRTDEAQALPAERSKNIGRAVGFGMGGLFSIIFQYLVMTFGGDQFLQPSYRLTVAGFCTFLVALVLSTSFELRRKVGSHAGLFATVGSSLASVILMQQGVIPSIFILVSCTLLGLVATVLGVLRERGHVDFS